MLGNAVCLNKIIIYLLIVFCINLDPSGIACSHTIGMITVDVNRTGQSSVYQCQSDWHTVGSCQQQFLPHQGQTSGRSCGQCPCACCLRSDAGTHCRMFTLDRNKLCINFAVCNVCGYHLRNLCGRRDRKCRHNIRIYLFDCIGNGLVT